MKNITISIFFDKSSRKMISLFLTKERVSDLVTFSSICFLFFSSQIYGQFANVNPPGGGFAIDGGLRANTPTSPTPPFGANQGDWYPGAVNSGSGGSVFKSDGSPYNSDTSGRVKSEDELYNSTADNVFATGSKFEDYISALRWTRSSAPTKNDIDNALYHVARDSNNNQWIFMAGDRLSTSGTSYIDFELLQGEITVNSDGTFSGTTLNDATHGGGRTLNDIVISMAYTSGGSKPTVTIWQWQKVGTIWSYQPVTSLPQDKAFAETNRTGVETNVPYSAFGSNTYQQFAFVESAINVTYLLTQLQNGSFCSNLAIKNLWVKTKASASDTAALKDFITPISVNFHFGTIAAEAGGPDVVCQSADPAAITLTGASVSGADTGAWSIVSGGGTLSNTTQTATPATVTYTPAVNYFGTVTLRLTTNAVGTCPAVNADRTITVNANPTVAVNSPIKCTSELPATITAEPSPAASGTVIYDYAWTVPAGASAPGNVASFSTSTDGTYSVIITNRGTTCTGSGSGTLIVNANPTVTVNSPTKCSSDAVVAITAIPSPSGSYNYVWTVPAGVTAPGNVATFNSSVAGPYSVVITNPSTTCTGSGSGILTVNANPAAPSLDTTQPSLCGTSTTGSIKVNNPTVGYTYTLFLNGVYNKEIIASQGGSVIFDGLIAGSNPTVNVKTDKGCISDAAGCPPLPLTTGKIASTDTKTTVIAAPIEGKTTSTGFDAYPVPFKDQLTIKYKFDYKSDVKIEVFNAQGMSVLSKTDSDIYLDKEVTLDLKASKRQDQVYVVKVTTNQETFTKKVMSSK